MDVSVLGSNISFKKTGNSQMKLKEIEYYCVRGVI
jgi:hypothetical protein